MYLISMHMDHRDAVYLAIGYSNFGHELFVWFSCLSCVNWFSDLTSELPFLFLPTISEI